MQFVFIFFFSATSGEGTSSDPCSQLYRGESAFSEPESSALKSAILEVKDRLQVRNIDVIIVIRRNYDTKLVNIDN